VNASLLDPHQSCAISNRVSANATTISAEDPANAANMDSLIIRHALVNLKLLFDIIVCVLTSF
jgi:hypothetical protein